MTLRAPFPWFGGKSRVAHEVWQRFGDVPNYVEPFAGSLAVLLARPTKPRIETVNDLDAYLANFWRAVAADPEAVAHFADWPVNEADLHARHRWLVNQSEFRERMRTDPEFYDAKIAGWWVWGICQWIGSGWCSAPEWTGRANAGRAAGRAARGIATAGQNVRPHLGSQGVNAKRPSLTAKGGIHRSKRVMAAAGVHEKRPVLSHGGNRGVVMGEPRGQKPMLRGDGGAAGAGIHASALTVREQFPESPKTREAILQWMLALQDRLRRVRVCCGDWSRVLGRSATECIGVTGVLLDPPYGTGANRDPSIYNHDDLSLAADVRKWAIANGDNPRLRIALCGYDGEHEMPETWECVAWKASGGYAASAGNHENSLRERIWFSPYCPRPQESLFPSIFESGLDIPAGRQDG